MKKLDEDTINNMIDQWHNSNSKLPLHEYLGMSREEYAKWVAPSKNIVSEEIVKFVSAKPYLNVSDKEFNKLFFCLQGRKEVVVLCSDELKDILRNLPSDYLIPRLKDIKTYLDSKNINYIEDFKNTTIV